MVENAYRNVAKLQEQGLEINYKEIAAKSAKQVGRAIFFSEAIIVVSFLPVFLLEGQEGKMFHPLAFTKTFALVSAFLLGIIVLPTIVYILFNVRVPEKKVRRIFNIII